MTTPYLALVRNVTDAITQCELTHLAREPIDVARARRQHAAYEALLGTLGCTVEVIPAPGHQPDAVFIEDTALVFDEMAVITRPGALSRRVEVEPVAARLGRERALVRLDPPATLDGGDVVRSGKSVFVGETSRTNAAGIEALRSALAPHGYSVTGVPVTSCLHLKSAATEAAPGVILVNPAWVDPAAFAGMETIAVDPAEPGAANVLRIGSALVQDAAYPRTRAALERRGLAVHSVDLSELAKAEGAVTCCSLIVARGPGYLPETL